MNDTERVEVDNCVEQAFKFDQDIFCDFGSVQVASLFGSNQVHQILRFAVGGNVFAVPIEVIGIRKVLWFKLRGTVSNRKIEVLGERAISQVLLCFGNCFQVLCAIIDNIPNPLLNPLLTLHLRNNAGYIVSIRNWIAFRPRFAVDLRFKNTGIGAFSYDITATPHCLYKRRIPHGRINAGTHDRVADNEVDLE